jgi:hypothetical protein
VTGWGSTIVGLVAAGSVRLAAGEAQTLPGALAAAYATNLGSGRYRPGAARGSAALVEAARIALAGISSAAIGRHNADCLELPVALYDPPAHYEAVSEPFLAVMAAFAPHRVGSSADNAFP